MTSLAVSFKFALPFLHACHRGDFKAHPPNYEQCPNTVAVEIITTAINNVALTMCAYSAIELSGVILGSALIFKWRPRPFVLKAMNIFNFGGIATFTTLYSVLLYTNPSSASYPILLEVTFTIAYQISYALCFVPVIFLLIVSNSYIISVSKELINNQAKSVGVPGTSVAECEKTRQKQRSLLRHIRRAKIFAFGFVLVTVNFLAVSRVSIPFPLSALRILLLVMCVSVVSAFQFSMLEIVRLNSTALDSAVPQVNIETKDAITVII
ncbi:hypothetical protein BKA69DRAFT_1126742 [Paraphysoderma sedebokerense]|nr:hypothetical protein BKA69DRAFT_1126742 [Paraphysoderma sedebokerense]